MYMQSLYVVTAHVSHPHCDFPGLPDKPTLPGLSRLSQSRDRALGPAMSAVPTLRAALRAVEGMEEARWRWGMACR